MAASPRPARCLRSPLAWNVGKQSARGEPSKGRRLGAGGRGTRGLGGRPAGLRPLGRGGRKVRCSPVAKTSPCGHG